MKIQERTGAGGGRSSMPAPSMSGERLPAPPRERKPALAALAVLLILVGALGATMLVLRAGDRIEVVKVTDEIPAGGSVSKANTTSVMVAANSGINYVEWTQLDTLKTLKARSTIYEGTVVMGQMFGSDGGVAAGQATVGLSLKEGQYPTGIKAGNLVAAYRVGNTTGTGSSTGSSGSSSSGATTSLIVDKAKVTFVKSQASSGDVISSTNLPVTLTVDSTKAADLAQAAATGQVALVLIPSS
ncbi:hypothetical protein [Streptomyces sp. NBC_01538]|uniref:hypothetical protein n=1 Tax=Streptomyces sp. NBC_01538 TaxID=2903897 RepID=UPI003869E9CC